jgi:hypothetical protein
MLRPTRQTGRWQSYRRCQSVSMVRPKSLVVLLHFQTISTPFMWRRCWWWEA